MITKVAMGFLGGSLGRLGRILGPAAVRTGTTLGGMARNAATTARPHFARVTNYIKQNPWKVGGAAGATVGAYQLGKSQAQTQDLNQQPKVGV